MTHWLTPHFSLEELTDSQEAARRGINNVPPEGSPEYKNLILLAQTLEHARHMLNGHPIIISSGYRCPEVNKAVGGSKTSVHMKGLAADFICPGFGDPIDVCKRLELDMSELRIDQLIHEYNQWVHLGLSTGQPRHMALTINENGTKHGFA